MRYDTGEIAKADPALRSALRGAQPDDRIRVVLELSPPPEAPGDPEAAVAEAPVPPPTTRADYRRDLLRREEGSKNAVAAIVAALRRLSLTVWGGDLLATVVVEGVVRQIVRSLQLPGVRSAALDQVIEVHQRPRR